MISEILKRRVKPKPFTPLWLKTWAKRAFHMRGILTLAFNHKIVKAGGATVGTLAIIHKSSIEGRLKNLKVGDGAFIAKDARIMTHGSIHIGANACINSGARIITASHHLTSPNWDTKIAPVVICDFAWIASGAIILPGVRIGVGAVVGAGSVVRSDVEDYAVVSGNPATKTSITRAKTLTYSPATRSAVFEAWLGKDAFLETSA